MVAAAGLVPAALRAGLPAAFAALPEADFAFVDAALIDFLAVAMDAYVTWISLGIRGAAILSSLQRGPAMPGAAEVNMLSRPASAVECCAVLH
ncbi:MAG: hypothetical protein ACXWC6_02990 [Ramlibacter sp.]